MNKKYDLHLKGFVGGYDFDSAYVEYVLSRHPDSEVTVLIDSLGGSLATALSIASAFSRHGNVSVHFAGMNASAATIAALGAKRVTMEASAMYLVHKCSSSVFEWGSLNADELSALIADLEAQKRDLEKMDLNVATMYAKRTCKPKNELLDLMKVGGWMTADEAKEWGFIDEIAEGQFPAPVLTDEVATALASAGIPVPDIPVSRKETAFARFLSAFTAFLSGSRDKASANAADEPQTDSPSINTIMNTSYKTVMALLAVGALTADADGSITLTAEQMQILDDKLQTMQADAETKNAEVTTQADKITALTAQVDNLQKEIDTLRKAPGETSVNVVDGGAEQDVNSFVDTMAKACALFDQLP